MQKKHFRGIGYLTIVLMMVALIWACDNSSSSPPQSVDGRLGAASIGMLSGELLDNLIKSVSIDNTDLSKLNPGEPLFVSASSVGELSEDETDAILSWVDEYNPVVLLQPNESQLKAFQQILGNDRTGGKAHVGDGQSYLEAFSFSIGPDGSSYVGTYHPHVGPSDDEATQDKRADALIDWIYNEVPKRVAQNKTGSSEPGATVMSDISTSLPSVVKNSTGSYEVTVPCTEDCTDSEGSFSEYIYGGNVTVNVVLNMYPVFNHSSGEFWLAVAMEPEIKAQDFAAMGDYLWPQQPVLPNMYTFSSTLNGGIMDQNIPATTAESETFTNGFTWNIGFQGTAKGGATVTAGASWSNTTSKTISSVAVKNQGSGGNQEVQFILNGCNTSAQSSTFTAGPSTLWYVQEQTEGNEVSFNFNLQVQVFQAEWSDDPQSNLDNSCQTSWCNSGSSDLPCDGTATALSSTYSIEVPKKKSWF